MASTLYICYFGVREPLVQTQVLPYLREIGKAPIAVDGSGESVEVKVSLLTFEPSRDERDLAEFAEIRASLTTEGIEWEWLPYHKRPSAVATAWDIFRGTIRVWRMHRRQPFDIFHCRVHVPGVIGALARKFSSREPKILFDIRGFFPEEFVDAGIWPENGLIFRAAKRVERWLMKGSDAFVVLTEKAREILADEIGTRPFEVIPCCVDIERFAAATPESRAEMRARLGIADRRVLAYVGSFGGWYLTEETADMFKAFFERYPNAYALILTQGKPEMIEPHLNERGISPDDRLIRKVPSGEIPMYLSAADVAVSFIKPSYSKQASSPTKNAEYLACGLPIIANAGIGDVDRLVTEDRVGTLLTEFSPEGYAAALAEIERLGDISDRCREAARSHFDVSSIGGKRYRRIYGRMLSGHYGER